MRRALLRVRRLLARLGTHLRWVPQAVVLALAVLVVGGTIIATAVGADWTDILRSQAINIVFAAVLAGFAYLLFFLRFRQAQLTRYLERSRLTASHPGNVEEADPLAKTIVDELLDARPPHACLIKSPAETEHSPLLADVAARLAEKRRVPVVVDLASEASNAGLPALTRDRFVTQLVGSSGDAQSGRRLYASLVRKQKVVALVRGLDQVGQGKPLAARRAALNDLLEGSLAEGIPFVAWVKEDLAPFISEVAAFRARRMLPSELSNYIRRELQQRDSHPEGELAESAQPFSEAFKTEPTRDVALVDLAVGLLARRVRAGEDGGHAIRSLFSDTCVFRRHLAWMCEWTLYCALDEIRASNSPVLVALAAIGREAHYQKEPQLSWDDSSRTLDAENLQRFAAGVASLSQRGVITVSGAGSGRGIRFTHPMWFSFAGTLGLKLDEDHWRDLLQSGVPADTLDALTGALLTFGRRAASGGSFVRVLRQVGLGETTDISLEMALAVIVALQADGEPLDMGDLEVEILHKSWSASNDLVRLSFVSNVDFARDLALIDFLWEQVTYPRFDKNSFRVRRAICTELGQLGTRAWRRLHEQWQGLVEAASREDLSTWSRRDNRWKDQGYGLASLGWVLPGLLLTIPNDEADTAYELLADLRAVVQDEGRSSGLSRPRPPEIGLEISLAEGFKAAAVERFNAAAVENRAPSQAVDGQWWSLALSLLESSGSWISQQALVQALALVAPEDTGSQTREVVRRWERSARKHPFVRETARLVGRGLEKLERRKASVLMAEGDPSSVTLTEEDIWFEEEEALEDGGVNLSPEAHRLLGLSTLLINMSEWRFNRWRKRKDTDNHAVEARQQAFTGIELPKCFRRYNHATTMFIAECDEGRSCSFHLCGPDAQKGVLEERRVISRSFLQRAQATARWVPSKGTRFSLLARRVWCALTGQDEGPILVAKAFEPIWSSLDKEMESRQSG